MAPLLSLLVGLSALVGANDGVAWHSRLADAQSEARKADKPIFMAFEAPWCYSCYYMEKHVLSGPAFAKIAGTMAPLKIDVDTEEGYGLKARYAVRYLPSFVVTDSSGTELGRVIGEHSEAEFMHALGGALSAAAPAESAKRLDALRGKVEQGDAAAFEELVSRPPDCGLPYDVKDGNAALLSKLPGERGQRLLRAEAAALESLAERKLFVAQENRCADFRTGVETLADVYETLGDHAARMRTLAKAAALLEKDGLKVGEDRNHDDNLRYFLDLSGDGARLRVFFDELIAAYPSDYVYCYRLAKFLQQSGKSAQALPFIEKADRLAYGANRLLVTKVRALILADLGRTQEAKALLKRDIKFGQKAFAGEVRPLQDVLDKL